MHLSESMERLPIAAKPKRTIADALMSKKISLKECAPSDSEEQHYASEPELKIGFSQLSSSSDPERGYTTDSLVIPHRHRQSRVTHSPQKCRAETITGDQVVEETESPISIEHYFDSQEYPTVTHFENKMPRKKALFDKLEAQLDASMKSASGRSSPLSDVQPQESFQAHERQSFKGSQSSLARLQNSSTTLTSYHPTASDDDSLDNSHGAQYSASKLQTVSQLSPHNSDHSDFSHGGQSNKSKSQTVSSLLYDKFDDSYQNHDAQSNKSKFLTVSQQSPQSLPCSTSQTASNSPNMDFLKGYQSDTTHVYTRPVSSIKQTSSPHMCSDTENDRLVPYNRLDSVKLQLKGQKGLQLTSQQNNSPQGIRSDSSDLILPSPVVANLKVFSGSNSSLSDSGSLGRGRSIISSVRGRGIASPSRGLGDSSPGSARGYESPNSGRGNVSPNRGRGIASLIASQGSGSPVRGRGTGSPVRGRGSPSPVGRGITLGYSPTQPGSPRSAETTFSKTVDDKYSDKEMPESPVPLKHYTGYPKSHTFMEDSGTQYHQDAVERFSDSGSMSSDKGIMSGHSKEPGRKSVLDKITNVCSKSPVPSASDPDMSESSVSHVNVQRRHENNVNMHSSVPAISNSSPRNVQENQTEIHRSGKYLNTQDRFREQNKHASDNEGYFQTQEQVRMPNSSETETDYFRNRRRHKIDKQAPYSSGTDTDSKSLVEKSAIGQHVLTKARLPKEFSGTDTDSMSLLAKSATGQQVYTKARVPRESSETDTVSMSLLAKSATGQQVFTKARLPKEASQTLRKASEKSSRTLPPE